MADAVDRLIVFRGRRTQVELAKVLGVSQQHLSAWLNRRKRPGLRHALNIEKRTGIPALGWTSVELNRGPRSGRRRSRRRRQAA